MVCIHIYMPIYINAYICMYIHTYKHKYKKIEIVSNHENAIILNPNHKTQGKRRILL